MSREGGVLGPLPASLWRRVPRKSLGCLGQPSIPACSGCAPGRGGRCHGKLTENLFTALTALCFVFCFVLFFNFPRECFGREWGLSTSPWHLSMQWELFILPRRDETPGWGRERDVWTVAMTHGALARSQWWLWDGWGHGAAQSWLSFANMFPPSCWERSQGTAEPGKMSIALQGKSVWKEMLLLGSSRTGLEAREPQEQRHSLNPALLPSAAGKPRDQTPPSSGGNPEH